MLGDDAQGAGPGSGSAGQLDVEVAAVQVEELGSSAGVVDVGAVGRVLVAARAGVHADTARSAAEPVQHVIVQVDEIVEQPAAGVELERQPSFGEVQLHESAPASRQCRMSSPPASQVVQERVPRIVVDGVRRIQQAQCGRGDDGLFERQARGPLAWSGRCPRSDRNEKGRRSIGAAGACARRRRDDRAVGREILHPVIG